MKNILICNSKGGVGKSLIADELAFYLEHKNISYNFYDLRAVLFTVTQNLIMLSFLVLTLRGLCRSSLLNGLNLLTLLSFLLVPLQGT